MGRISNEPDYGIKIKVIEPQEKNLTEGTDMAIIKFSWPSLWFVGNGWRGA